jgi:hypothetical protein
LGKDSLGKEKIVHINRTAFGCTGLLGCVVALLCVGAGARSKAPFTNAAPPSSDAKLTWTQFQDPFERAFSLEVPQGWTVRGGLFRMGYSDERPMVDLTSPDGRINIRIGDVTIPVYMVPNQYHPREGQINDLGAQAQLVVAKYRSGPEFAVLYSHVRFYQFCRNPSANTQDLDFVMPDYIPLETNPQSTSTGQIAYHCESNGAKSVAYAFARTTSFGDLWQAQTLASFLSSTDQLALARTVLLHCAHSFRISPQWIEYQKQMDAMALDYQRARQQQRLAALAHQVQEFEMQMSAMRQQVDAYRHHQEMQAKQVEDFSNALRGVTPTLDPLTGEAREVWTGTKSRYWANGLGTVVNSNESPSGNWHEIQPIP